MELPLEVINHSLGRESADLPAHNEIFPDYFPPLPAEEMMFLHQSGLVSIILLILKLKLKSLCQPEGNEASQCPKQGAGEIPPPYLPSLLPGSMSPWTCFKQQNEKSLVGNAGICIHT